MYVYKSLQNDKQHVISFASSLCIHYKSATFKYVKGQQELYKVKLQS